MSCHQTEMLVTDRKAKQFTMFNRKCLAAAYQMKGFNIIRIHFGLFV